MTTIHFHYTDSYNNPSRGSLAFMPHRRHAANETEILPKPFTIPLLNGEVSVNLQPNSSSWVWIVTEYFEGVSKSFYTTVPDRDGVMEHTELVHISPSSLPAPYDAVEPVWWAEMRQYKTTVSDTLVKSGEALTEAQAAIETGRESVERTQHNASVAGAYADESRQSSYDAREYRDEAEQWRNEAQEQADRAATGPESAAARADASAAAAAVSEAAALNYENQSRTHAAEARADATTAQTASTNAVTHSTEARQEADRSELEANRAQGYANDLLSGPQEYVTESQAARDAAQGYRDEAQTAATNAADSATLANAAQDAAAQHATAAETSSIEATTAVETIDNTATSLEYLNGWNTLTWATTYTPYYTNTPWGLLLHGVISGGDKEQPMFNLPITLPRQQRIPVMVSMTNFTMGLLIIDTNGDVRIETSVATPHVILNNVTVMIRQ